MERKINDQKRKGKGEDVWESGRKKEENELIKGNKIINNEKQKTLQEKEEKYGERGNLNDKKREKRIKLKSWKYHGFDEFCSEIF